MDEPLSSELLAKYLASEASAEERATVEAWAGADAANAAELNRLRTVWATKTAPRAWNVDRAWAKVSSETGKGATVTPIAPRRPWHANAAVRIAAAVVLMAGVTFAWREFGPGSNTPSQIFTTRVGERLTVDLADGTHVIIGPVSELRVARRYNRSVRRVDLTGEAWFEVKHDSARAFRVYAFGTITEDLGTSFSVRASAADSTVRVIVATGSAWVGLEGATVEQGATLLPRDVVEVDVRALKANVIRNVLVDPLLSWRTGHVEFSDALLSTVVVELQRWYGVTTRFDRPSLASGHVSYSMPTDNLEEALTVLRISLGVTIERKGDTLFVR